MGDHPDGLPGQREAILTGRAFSDRESRFWLDEETVPHQGHNNRLLLATWEGRPAVFKYFDDMIRKPDARRRKGIESFALRHWNGISGVPRLFAEGEDFLVMERLAGLPLTEAATGPTAPVVRNAMRQIGIECGRLYAALCGRPLPPGSLQPFCHAFFGGRTIRDQVLDLLAAARSLWAARPEFEPSGGTFEIIEDELPAILAEPAVLLRMDNNFPNVLIAGGRLSGFVDFELSRPGTESMFLGAMLNSIPEVYPLFADQPWWPAIRETYEQCRGASITPEKMRRVLSMAMLWHWARIVETTELDGTFDPQLPRYKSRFPLLQQMYAGLRVAA